MSLGLVLFDVFRVQLNLRTLILEGRINNLNAVHGSRFAMFWYNWASFYTALFGRLLGLDDVIHI